MSDLVGGIFPPRHFAIILGRIAHITTKNGWVTLCGRHLCDHPRIQDLTAQEALGRADCKTCRKVVRP